MARTKSLNIVVAYGYSEGEATGYVVNDIGENKSPRFELYHQPTKSVKIKSNNPLDFDEYMWDNIYKLRKESSNVQFTKN